jgi:hypothetical protein
MPSKSNRKIVMTALRSNGMALKYASRVFANDKTCVMTAVKQNGNAIKFASRSMTDDYEIMLEAVSQHGQLLEYASNDLLNNYDIVLAAVNEDGQAIKYALEGANTELFRQHPLLLLRSIANGFVLTPQQRIVVDKHITLELSKYESFKSTFLFGWGIPSNISPSDNNNTKKIARMQSDDKNCEEGEIRRRSRNHLSRLNKLGKYSSIKVKKLIADYAGICYGI